MIVSRCKIARPIAGKFIAVCAGIVLSPALLTSAAHANDSSADLAAPLRAAAAAPRPSGDQEFHQLFSSWQALDRPARNFVMVAPAEAAPAFTPAAASFARPFAAPSPVSIPSRMPVDSFKMTSGFGMRWHPVLGGRRAHKGVDLADPTGTPVFATADGVVGRADRFSGYGLYVQIEHGGNLETRYGHLSRIEVVAGQAVHKGELIGLVGATGRATGPHLHYEVRVAGVAVNPLPYMYGQGAPASVNRNAAMIAGEASPSRVPAPAFALAAAAPAAAVPGSAVGTSTATVAATEADGDE